MTDIKVILDDTPVVETNLSHEEREVIFDQIAAENPKIPRAIIDGFAAIQEDEINSTLRADKPTIKELLLRKIITLDTHQINITIIPIIAVSKNIALPGTIAAKFDQRVLTMTQEMRDYIAPAGEELQISGIVINQPCAAPKIGPKLAELTAVDPGRPEVGSRLLAGYFTHEMASAACDGYFLKPHYDIDITATNYSEPFVIDFADYDDEKLTKIFGILFDYLIETEIRHRHSGPIIYAQIRAAISAVSEDKPAAAGNPVTDKLLAAYQVAPEAPFPQENYAKKSAVLELLESIHNGRFNTRFDSSAVADIDMRGFSQIYNKAILKGKDDPEVAAGVTESLARKSRQLFIIKNKERLLDEKNKIGVYRMIIEKKLGAKRLQEIDKKLIAKPIIDSKGILDLLGPTERKPIEAEYRHREKFLEAVVNNKCPHVALYRAMRLARDDAKMYSSFLALKKYFKNAGDREMIACNNCGFDIICPHIRDLTELNQAGKPFKEVRAKLTKYVNQVAIRDQYYCKICGEVISSLEAFGDLSNTIADSSDDELKKFIWAEIAMLTKYLRFDNLVNVPKLISAARDACYPYMYEIEKQIIKSKTNSAEETKAKKRLYVAIYAFAYFIHIVSQHSEIKFKNLTTGKSPVVEMIKFSLEAIMLSRNIIIREIPGMTADIIKNTLIEAYKSIQSSPDDIIIRSGDAEDILTTLLLDPIFNYYYIMNTIDGMLHGKPAPTKKFDRVDSVDNILGMPISKVEKSTNVFGSVLRPKFDAKWNMNEFMQLKPLHNGRTRNASGRVFASAYPGYMAASFKLFDKKIANQTYNKPLYIDTGSGQTLNIELRPVHKELRDEFLGLDELESRLLQYNSLDAAQGYLVFPSDKNLRWIDPHASLSRIYDENGIKHSWDIYIVDEMLDEKINRKEYKIKDISSMVESGKKFSAQITDKKCSICGILASATGGLSDAKIRNSLDSLRVVSNFFRFYENRCPRGGLHEFTGNNCAKCTMDIEFLVANTGPKAQSFYHEYASIYAKERNEFTEIISINSESFAMPDDKYSAEYESWAPNLNVTLELANELGINYRLLSALGAVEKQEYADVQSGAFIPSEATNRNSTRANMIVAHIKSLIMEYNKLKFFHRLIRPPYELSAIVENSGISKHLIGELPKKLPDIFNDFNARYAHILQHKKPREIVEFCIQTFCEMCLQIYNDKNQETKKLRQEFVSYMVKKILRYEELVTKPGHFSWALLYGDKEPKESDSNYTSEKNDEPVDDENPAPFSMDDFDVESQSDDEGGVRVGENLGLD